MTSYQFFKTAAIESEIYFRVRFFGYGTRLGRWKSTSIPNFDEICQYTAEIKLIPVSENGRSPFWNSISGFYFWLIVVIGALFCSTVGFACMVC